MKILLDTIMIISLLWFITQGTVKITVQLLKNLAEIVIDDMKNEFKFINDEDQEKTLLKHIKYTKTQKVKRKYA